MSDTAARTRLPSAPSPDARRRRWLAAAATGLALPWLRPAQAAADNPDNERWQSIREGLFGRRPIGADLGDVLELDTPVRAADAAVVPVAIRARQPQGAQRYIRTIWLVVDHNPSPVGAVFHFTPQSGRAEIETRIRLEEYTQVRAIAEHSDGTLTMRSRYVKASGGCSAPAGKDLEAAMAGLGRLRLRADAPATASEPHTGLLMVSHPNISGLAIDQVTRLAPAPRFVRQVRVTYAGQPVLEAEIDFTISENPSLRFRFQADADGELSATVTDTENARFEARLAVRHGPAA